MITFVIIKVNYLELIKIKSFMNSQQLIFRIIKIITTMRVFNLIILINMINNAHIFQGTKLKEANLTKVICKKIIMLTIKT